MLATFDSQQVRITPDAMLPDILRAYPSTRSVFDRYGLSGCGGRLGPVESVRFFARAHGVNEAQLLVELEAAAQGVDPAAEPASPVACATADTICRRFFVAGILLILTAGATWGAWLLWQIGFRGQFTAVSIHDVNAHGHAQIFGWVGLFIMGFGYQAFPRIWHTKLPAPRLAAAAFLLMLVGLILCPIAMTQAGTWPLAPQLALLGGALELVAVLLFAGQIVAAFRRSEARVEPYIGFIFTAIGWFIVMTALSAWHTWTTMTAGTRDELLWYVKAYQAPLRDVQIHGLAMFMILGVCLRMLPGLFDAPRIAERRAWASLAILTAGVIGEIGVYLAYVHTGSHAVAALLMIPWLLLAGGIVMLVWPWKLWRPLPVADRSAKFIRAAYGWLAISMLMLLMLPVYQVISGIPFSHAYYGAIRHAITVGFISLMIMGFAAKVVPTLNGVDPRTLSSLMGPFILVNLGCFLRCSLQTLTDWDPRFFAVVGVSGVLEVTGLAWWGIGLIAIILRGRREELGLERQRQLGPPPAEITAEHYAADVLEWFPQTQAVFDRFGFAALRNGLLRRTIGRSTTLRRAAGMKGVSLESLLQELNAVAGLGKTRPDTRPIELPVLVER